MIELYGLYNRENRQRRRECDGLSGIASQQVS
jgi:hypothetical protein